jgi:ATP-dependent protease ClpP protease subunit
MSLRALIAAAALAWTSGAHAMGYEYRVTNDRLIIAAQGDIGEDEVETFLAFVDVMPREVFALFDRPEGAIVTLASRGGRASAALRLANLFAAYKVDTRVSAHEWCASACVMVWASGRHKSVGPGARVGVHSATFDPTAPVAKLIDASEGQLAAVDITRTMALWFERTGAPATVVAKTMTTPGEDIYWLSERELSGWGARIDH